MHYEMGCNRTRPYFVRCSWRVVGQTEVVQKLPSAELLRRVRFRLAGFLRSRFETTQSYLLAAGLRRAGSSRISRRAVAQ